MADGDGMSVDRQYGRIIFSCECGDTFEANSRDFNEAVQELKDNGWLITKNDAGEFEHWCRQPCEPYEPENSPGGCSEHPNATHETGFGLAGGGYGLYSVCNECGCIFDKIQEMDT